MDQNNYMLTGIIFAFVGLFSLITKNAYLSFYSHYAAWTRKYTRVVTAVFAMLGLTLTIVSVTHSLGKNRELNVMLLIVGLGMAVGSPVLSRATAAFSEAIAADEDTLSHNYVLASVLAIAIGLLLLGVGLVHKFHSANA